MMKKIILVPLILFSINSFPQTISGKTNSVSVDYSPKQSGIPGGIKYRALIMGVSKYLYEGPGLQSLDNPTKDAQTVYETLTKEYTFDPENVILLKDPTRKQIIDGFEQLANEATENDNVLVFYAGHGVWEKQKELGYWLPSDVKLTSKSDWLANSQIKDYLSESVTKSKHVLLVTDACFGGSIFKSRSVNAETIVRINELYREPSRTAMTSGSLSTVPDRSVFTQQLVKKLVDNEEDYLPARQLFSRIYEPVINNSSTNPVYGVIQGAGDGGGDFIFIRRKK
jgi:uncharacterized caspase-like protein